MSTDLTNLVLSEIDTLIEWFTVRKRRSIKDDFSDLDEGDMLEFINVGTALIYRVAGPTSTFAHDNEKVLDSIYWQYYGLRAFQIYGALRGLRRAVENGSLVPLKELIHANLFADFLEMAEHLLGEGYKDPAAVMIGGVLEEHIRKLCQKEGIAIEVIDSKGKVHPKPFECSDPKKLDTKSAGLIFNIGTGCLAHQSASYSAGVR